MLILTDRNRHFALQSQRLKDSGFIGTKTNETNTKNKSLDVAVIGK